jgi:hypothetical protein
MTIPLDRLTLHNDDYTRVGWLDMPQGDPPRGSIPLITINFDAVKKRETTDLLRRISQRKGEL